MGWAVYGNQNKGEQKILSTSIIICGKISSEKEKKDILNILHHLVSCPP
jgi:hypothetical protein